VDGPKTQLAQHIERILDAARLAPSYENAQPWRFVVEGDTVSFLVDRERDRSPPGAGGRMARIAVGAALECALVRAGRMGAAVRFEAPRGSALVTVTISDPKRVPEPDKALLRRATNRRPYDGRAVDDATFAWLQEACEMELDTSGKTRVAIGTSLSPSGERPLMERKAPFMNQEATSSERRATKRE